MYKPMVSEMCQVEGELSLSGPLLADLMQSVLAKDKSFRFQAKGTSMYPFIRDGDIIVVSPLNLEEPHLGDVVACLRPNTDRLVVHRILKAQSSRYFLQGDNVPSDDGWLPRDRLLGRVVRVERNGREAHFGLGIERLLIVWLARMRWLVPLIHCRLWRVVLPVARRIRS